MKKLLIILFFPLYLTSFNLSLNSGANGDKPYSVLQLSDEQEFECVEQILAYDTKRYVCMLDDEILPKIEDINLIIPHQANQRIINNVAKKFNISNDKFFVNLEKYGNTSAASIPMALCEAFESKKITKGDKVILVGFGGGLTWGSTIIEI